MLSNLPRSCFNVGRITEIYVKSLKLIPLKFQENVRNW